MLALVWSMTGVGSGEVAASDLDGCPEIIVSTFGETAPIACRVAWCESGWNPDAVSHTQDYGLFQLHRPVHGTWASLDPEINVSYAYELSNGGTNWSPWRSSQRCWGGIL